jgi:WD40 repeat protein
LLFSQPAKLVVATGQVNCRPTTVTFSPDEKTVATVDGKTIKLWTIATGKELQTFQGDTVTFSPDKKTVATVDSKTIKLWSVMTGKEVSVYFRV